MYNPVGYSSIGSVNVSLKGDILLLAIGYDKLAMPRGTKTRLGNSNWLLTMND